MIRPKNLGFDLNHKLNRSIYIKLLKMKTHVYSNVDYLIDERLRSILRYKLSESIGSKLQDRLTLDINNEQTK